MKKASELSCFKLLFCSFGIALLLVNSGCTVFQSSIPTVAKQSIQPQRFAQWCQRQSTTSEATKHTVNALLKIAKTKDCELADTKLRSITYLNLRDSHISDLRPLAGLTQVDTLLLDNTQISDLRPLVSLNNIYFITLNNNQISDLQPLTSMNGLTTINLEKNRISDIKPLATLTKVRELTLNDNQITDIQPLATLRKLEQLHVRRNPLSDKTCPIQSFNFILPFLSVCRFDET